MNSNDSSPSSTTSASDSLLLPTPLLGMMDSSNVVSPEIMSPGSYATHDVPPTDLFSPSAPKSFSRPGMSRGMSKTRAPAPPPIMLRQPNSLVDRPAPISSSSTASAKGLNIPGIPLSAEAFISQDPEVEAAEVGDGLADMLPSPRRTSFAQTLRNPELAGLGPSSPAWQSLESPRFRQSLDVPNIAAFTVPTSPAAGLAHERRQSQSTRLPPPAASASLSHSPTPGRFDPTPTHGLHARNLSLFFPQPGAVPIPTSPQPDAPVVALPAGERRAFQGISQWKFGSSSTSGDTGAKDEGPEAPRGKRRGHHHKHSLSHNFFSFLDPTITNPSLANSPVPTVPSSPRPPDAPQSVPMPLLSSSLSLSSSSAPSKSDPAVQLLASFTFMEFMIGAGLWVEGQMGGWRSLAGVGYLVVFDALGVGVSMIARSGEGWRSTRRPYGNARLLSLLCFVQSLFLVFAAVYISKESLESVILGSAAHEHGSGGHGHSHGDFVAEGDERPFPAFLLACAATASIISALFMDNHAKLVDAVGVLFLPLSYTRKDFVRKHAPVLANPFTLSVFTTTLGMLLGTISLPSSALRTFDSLSALLLTLLTTSLALPPTKTFALVLLQSAPQPSTHQMTKIRRALKDLRDDRRLLEIGTVRCWAITAGTAPPPETPVSTPSGSRNPSVSGSGDWGDMLTHPHVTSEHSQAQRDGSPRRRLVSPSSSPTSNQFGFAKKSSFPSLLNSMKEKEVPCVISVEVHVEKEASENDVLEVTKKVWMAIGRCAGRGEVTVGVVRGWKE